MIGFNQILKLELKEYKLESIYELNLSVPRASVLGHFRFLLDIIEIHLCSGRLKFYLFAQGTNIVMARISKRSNKWLMQG